MGVRSSGYADERILGIEVIKGDAGKKWPCSNVRKEKVDRFNWLRLSAQILIVLLAFIHGVTANPVNSPTPRC